jgi:hypothetical protein
MTNMRLPQHGQGWASGCAAAGSISTALRPQALPAPEFARSRDRLGTVRAGEQAVVADAMEALGQNVNEKPADELADIEYHRRVQAGAFDPVVFDLEHDAVLVDRDQTAVRAGVAVGISRQIGEYGLRARERTLGVDEPALLAERGEECRERLRIDKMRVCAKELQAARLVPSPVTCVRSNSYCGRRNTPNRAAAPSRESGFVHWHELAVRGRAEYACSPRAFQTSTCSAIARASSTSIPR